MLLFTTSYEHKKTDDRVLNSEIEWAESNVILQCDHMAINLILFPPGY